MGIIEPITWSISFIFMADGLWRIRNLMRVVTDCIIVEEVFFTYGATAAVAILG